MTSLPDTPFAAKLNASLWTAVYLADGGNEVDDERRDQVKGEIERLNALVGMLLVEMLWDDEEDDDEDDDDDDDGDDDDDDECVVDAASVAEARVGTDDDERAQRRRRRLHRQRPA